MIHRKRGQGSTVKARVPSLNDPAGAILRLIWNAKDVRGNA
jgi:hypothetical protein